MKRRLFKITLTAAAFLLGAGVAVSAQNVILPGHVSERTRASTRLDDVSPGEQVDLSLSVRLDQALVDQTLAELYGPGAPANPPFLSPAEFAQKFDVAAKRQKLKDFAAAAGFTVDQTDTRPGSLIVKISGTADQVKKTFGVGLHHYRAADGQVFRANDADPSIPESLVPHINAVLGLSNYRGAMRPHLTRARPRTGASIPGAASPALSGTHGATSGGLAPADIKTIYSLSGPATGYGQTVALLELDGYTENVSGYPSDVALYESAYGLPTTPVTCTSADGKCGKCGTSQNQTCSSPLLASDGNMLEVALDIEMVIALAPGVSNILVYTADNNGLDPLTAFNDIAAADTAKIVSTSWGAAEQDLGTAAMNSEEGAFATMALHGQTIFAAAGDNGAYDCNACGVTALAVDDPASQPNVTGVGGTSLSGSVGAVGVSATETVWNDHCVDSSGGPESCSTSGASVEGTGGGIANYVNGSTYWPLPSYQNSVTGTASQTYRNVPDVTLNADPNASPYSICVGGSCNSCGNPCNTLIGGTSAAAPLWAAMTALINQNRTSNGQAVLGFANPSIYSLAQSAAYAGNFNDVTSGNNGNDNSLGSSPNGYSAGTGYDNVSGWGSFKANNLISALSLPSTIVAASPEFTDVGVASITVNWSNAGLPAGTTYTAQISTNNFATINVASVTANSFASFGTGGAGPALIPATTYYFRVQAASGTYASGVSSLGDTVTLASAPFSVSLTQVWASSLTMSWAATNPAGTSYRVDYWQAIGSTTSVFTTSTNPTLTGLAAGATFSITVGALNSLGKLAPSGIILSTVTILQPTLTAVVPSTGGVVTIHPPSGLITLQIPSGAIDQTVAVTLALPTGFPAPTSSAASLTGTGLGIEILTEPAVEPLTNTLLTISYQNPNVANLNPHELVVARYDTANDVWVPLVSSVNTSQGTVTGLTSHWSLFQLMQSAPSATATTAKVFPNPWRISSGPATMTFSLLPAGARLRLYTLTGHLIKDFSADASGLASWDGTNESGRPAASGFYFLYIEGGGQSTTLKLAIQR